LHAAAGRAASARRSTKDAEQQGPQKQEKADLGYSLSDGQNVSEKVGRIPDSGGKRFCSEQSAALPRR